MSILIKGIEIPEDNTVLLRIYPESEGVFYVEQLDIDDDILDKYWAIHVPEHGRLIDADALKESIKEARKAQPEIADVYDDDYFLVAEWLASAPTIIPADPAEEGEE